MNTIENINKLVALVVGVVLTLVGIAGFFVDGNLLGFGVNTLHNLVHLLTGAVAIVMAMAGLSQLYNRAAGLVYILVTILGFGVLDVMAQLLAVNMADNFLHLALGLVLAGVGFGVKE